MRPHRALEKRESGNRHRGDSSGTRITNHVEHFNCTLRQRVSRLVRATLSFSKKLDNHIGAIKFFLSHYMRLEQPYLCSTTKFWGTTGSPRLLFI